MDHNFANDVRNRLILSPLMAIKDNEWSTSILECMNTMRKQRAFHDVLLCVGKHEIPAHRAILACYSPYMADQLQLSKIPNKEESMLRKDLVEIDSGSAEMLVEFAYTGKLEITGQHVSSLYHASNLWQVQKVKAACGIHLHGNMNWSNCIEIYKLAKAENDMELSIAAEECIKNNMEHVATTHEFTELPRIKIELIATQTKETIHSDKALFDTALNWIRRTIKSGMSYEKLLDEPQTLLLTADKDLKRLEEVEELEATLIEDYNLDPTKVGALTPERKLSNGQEARPKNKNNNSSTPRKLIMAPEEDGTSYRNSAWKVIGATDMADFRYVALAEVDGELVCIVLYEKQQSPKIKRKTKRNLSIETCNHHPPLAQMGRSLCAFGCAVINGKIVISGGYDKTRAYKKVQLYDPETNTWASLKSMTNPRIRFEISVIDDRTYAIGGSDGMNELKSCEVFDMKTGWQPMASMHRERSNFGATVLDGKLYVIGGHRDGICIKSCEVYDPKLDQWTEIAPLQKVRSQLGVCTLGGKIYAVGGTSTWSCVNSVEVYDPDLNEWTAAPSMKTNRRAAGVCVHNDKIYAVGGSDGQSVLDSVEYFDPQSQTWSTAASMDNPRMNLKVISVRDAIYAMGGFNGQLTLDNMQHYKADADQWYSHAMHLLRRQSATPSPPSSPVDLKKKIIGSAESSETESL
ncbi:influenza virus NS1A-binding protein-like [Apostichopus japonicus]|uniref:influenza virus NS1A-binding protein-like n=1 Tax=Stichopus japonicus TaxID=307972 RepID=UPI003AB82EB2